MKCDWVRDNLIFYVYNELEDDARYEVEQHLGRCPECTSELKATRKSDRSHVVLWAKELTRDFVFLRPLGLRL